MILSLNDIKQLLSPWQSAYGDSAVIATTVTAIHLIGMLVGGGLAISADRATLRVTSEHSGKREWHLGELNAIHRPVLIALSIIFVSGLAMVASDIKIFLTSPILWVKLGLVALLVLNGVVLERTETALRTGSDFASALWTRLRVSAIASIVLWIGILVTGVALANAA